MNDADLLSMDPMDICRAALLATGVPATTVGKLIPGRVTDVLVQLVVVDGHPYEAVKASLDKNLPGWDNPQ